MVNYKIQILETVLIISIYIISFFVIKTTINNALKNVELQRARRKIIIKALQLFALIIAIIFMAAVWGLKQNEIALFASTILTAIGVAFFAQWSLLSNITASIILFFNHPLKLRNTIKVLDKDFPYEGEIIELTYFFIHLKSENNEIITIPNSLLLQKSISIVQKDSI